MRLWAGVLAALLASSCYSSHHLERDAAAPRGDGPAAPPYDAAACPPIGGYQRCGEGCGDAWCNRGVLYCDRDLTICGPGGGDVRTFDECVMSPLIPSSFSAARYCWSGLVCAGLRSDLEDGDLRWEGTCVEPSFCDEVDAHLDGIVCLWSDLSERRVGAPEERVCPPADPRDPFCGGPCADCPWPERGLPPVFRDDYRVSCVGLSDRRGVGICGVNTAAPCMDGRSANAACANEYADGAASLFDREPCACLVLEDPNAPGTFHPWGWATLADSCRRYRERYPAQVRCLE